MKKVNFQGPIPFHYFPILFLFVFCAFIGSVMLTPAEKALLNRMKIDEELALRVKKQACAGFLFSAPVFTEFTNTGEDGKVSDLSGVVIQVKESKAEELMNMFSALAAEKGCMIFRSQQNFNIGKKPDEIAIIKTRDQYDIIRAMGTDGINYDITTEDLIKKLKSWEKICKFRINGASYDWLSAAFITPPKDMAAFAKDMYKFCPDAVEQGTGTVEALALEMKKTNSMYMWWD